MNLLTHPWLKVVIAEQNTVIALDQLTTPGLRDLTFSRVDFNGAVYQMLIGLLQTTMAPTNIKQWLVHYLKPPTADQLQAAFAPHLAAFELVNDQGPAFMQDLTLADADSNPMSSLLIEAPGGNTLKQNTDHFIKRGGCEKTCPSCTAAALYTLQTMSPSGGAGYRTSLRGGGGGLATLVLPQQPDASLWRKLWLNVMPSDEAFLNTEHHRPEDIFPWLAPTPTSEKKASEVLPIQVNPLQMYWGMPRRLRLDTVATVAGHCDLCGDLSDVNYQQLMVKNYGINYGDNWLHFLTPYRFDLKKIKPPLSVKGKQGGLSYKDWLGLAMGNEANGEHAATTVQHFLNQKIHRLDKPDQDFRLWCFGYDMDNAKARCWYEHTLPLVYLAAEDKDRFLNRIDQYLALARDAVSILRQAIKQAWFTRAGDAKGDLSKVDSGFWQASEHDFFTLIQRLKAQTEERGRIQQCDQFWLDKMECLLEGQFDHWAMDKFTADKDLPRIVKARLSLKKQYSSSKSYKPIKQRVNDAKKKETP